MQWDYAMIKREKQKGFMVHNWFWINGEGLCLAFLPVGKLRVIEYGY